MPLQADTQVFKITYPPQTTPTHPTMPPGDDAVKLITNALTQAGYPPLAVEPIE